MMQTATQTVIECKTVMLQPEPSSTNRQ